ncbi:MAG: single-stranded DNA-binding protein [Actinobacteria bacterium]|nr:single-stranded DNA-binding protein [Actinomycetota bacterium]
MTDTITVVGNIATVPQPGSTATGFATLSFRMATNHRRQDASGAWIDASTNWFEVKTYRTLAENAAASLTKGDAVIVTGRLKLREWEGKDGKRGMSVEIEADSIGPDLRRGRCVYQRTSHATPPTAEEPSDSAARMPAEVGASAGGQDGWATPGAEPVPF